MLADLIQAIGVVSGLSIYAEPWYWISGFQEYCPWSGGWLTGCVWKFPCIWDWIRTDWYHHLNSKVITEGHLCTAQAVIKQVGANGVALSYVFHGPCSLDSYASQSRLLFQVFSTYYLSTYCSFSYRKWTCYCGAHILCACAPLERTQDFLQACNSRDLDLYRPHYYNSLQQQ